MSTDNTTHTLLIVDDDPALRTMLGGRLEESGFEVLLADCGETAVQLAAESDIDVVILDIELPDIDGFEVCRRIKAIQQTSVIFVTGSEHGIVKRFCSLLTDAVGGDCWLRKPIQLSQILDMLRQVIMPPADTGPRAPRG